MLEKLSWIAGISSAIVAIIVWLWPSPPAPGGAINRTVSSNQSGTTNIQVSGGGTLVISSGAASPPFTQPITKPHESDLPDQGPSFNCIKATYKSEKIVCSSKELAILDLALANAYRDALAQVNAQNKPGLRNSQNYWIRVTRERCEVDIACLRSVYEQRINELKSLLH